MFFQPTPASFQCSFGYFQPYSAIFQLPFACFQPSVVLFQLPFAIFQPPSAPVQKPIGESQIARPADTALFADAAQVNTFQAPASPANPMFEEWYNLTLQTNYASFNNQPNGHFRHSQMGNVAFADGHLGLEMAAPGSFDKRLPSQFIGQLRPEILTVP